jgi:hypothetical protein
MKSRAPEPPVATRSHRHRIAAVARDDTGMPACSASTPQAERPGAITRYPYDAASAGAGMVFWLHEHEYLLW